MSTDLLRLDVRDASDATLLGAAVRVVGAAVGLAEPQQERLAVTLTEHGRALVGAGGGHVHLRLEDLNLCAQVDGDASGTVPTSLVEPLDSPLARP